MTDSELIQALESCTLPAGEFHHAEHVRLARAYLLRMPLMKAGRRLSDAIERFARHVGQPGLYHATITWAYLLLINERLHEGAGESWEAFARQHPDLLSWPEGALADYYSPERLVSEEARRDLVLPDRVPIPCKQVRNRQLQVTESPA